MLKKNQPSGPPDNRNSHYRKPEKPSRCRINFRMDFARRLFRETKKSVVAITLPMGLSACVSIRSFEQYRDSPSKTARDYAANLD